MAIAGYEGRLDHGSGAADQQWTLWSQPVEKRPVHAAGKERDLL